MTVRLDQIAPRLKKLLLMLSSDRDGEVVNAARLIGSTLQDAGRDWHDLAGALTAAAPQTRPKQPPPPPRDDHHGDGDDHHGSRTIDWRDARDFCLKHRGRLRGRELEFCTDLTHWRGSLTEKQASWLTAIYRRLRRAT
jgi:hypothetical protein